MSYDYGREFEQAINNTKSLGVSIDAIKLDKNVYFSDKSEPPAEIIEILHRLAKEKAQEGMPYYLPLALSIISNCGPFHFYMKPVIEKIFNCKTYITSGYIEIGESSFHKFDLEQIKESLTTKRLPSNHHIWLTLDSGEILDMTFPITYFSINDNVNFMNNLQEGLPIGFINAHPSKFVGGMRYHPVIIGDEVLKQAGHDLEILAAIVVSDT